MHAKHVLPGFKDRSAEERDIEAMTQSITRVRHPLAAQSLDLRRSQRLRCAA